MAKQTLREAIEAALDEWVKNGWDDTVLGLCAADDLRAILARFPKPSGSFRQATINVAIDSHGRWCVDTWLGVDARENFGDLAGGCVLRHVEVDIPLPEAPVTIEGTVVDAK